MEIMFEGTVVMGKNAFCTSGEILKECTEGFGDSTDSKEFVDPQCEPSANSVNPMKVEGPASSRARLAVNKGKGLASGVHLFRGICKKPRKNVHPCKRCLTLWRACQMLLLKVEV